MVNAFDQMFEDALKVVRMYYHLDMTTGEIASQLGFSRPKVSRLLTWAKENGVIEFRIIDHREHQLTLERELEDKFDISEVKVVPVAPTTGREQRLDQVVAFAAHYLNSIVRPNMILSLAWGNTVARLSRALIPKPLPGAQIVQLNGSGNSGSGITYAADIVTTFAANYRATPHLLPVPAHFDNPQTRDAMFEERTIKRARDLAARADIAVYGIGVPSADSYIYTAGYIERKELDELMEKGVVGDIGTVFFRIDGSYADLEINKRSSGPDLSALSDHTHAICVVEGTHKRQGILGALNGRFMNTLIIDEPTAISLLRA